ncbi:PPA1309 family protein [uncultured Nocardioides sp.]|uniref:PPA1309 family protein n=1 Tax=uncultured Nocardioides sp. TaxID=198441 RepID=UPI00263A3350|nr:PPA1309 family protein [uncultured Nocardioides sp.]
MSDDDLSDPALDTALVGDDLDTDPALAAAVLEIEGHVAGAGWDQPGRLYALVETARLVEREPSLAVQAGLADASADGSLTPIEQDQLPQERPLEEMLAEMAWPAEVAGCVAVVERLVLPPGADDELPADPEDAEAFARSHPDRQEVRMVAGVTRAGATYCALRLRAHDDDTSVVTGSDLVPGLVELVRSTLDDRTDEEQAP